MGESKACERIILGRDVISFLNPPAEVFGF